MIYCFALLFVCFAAVAGWGAAFVRRCRRQLGELQSKSNALTEDLEREKTASRRAYAEQAERMGVLSACIEDLKNGMVPDYEKAKAAARAVNDFNSGLTAIMDFDPMAAIKRQRDKGE